MADQTPKSYFEEKIAQKLQRTPDLAKSVNGIYEFNITGDSGGVWTVDLSKEPGMFAALNRGKRSAVIDLKSPAGAATLRDLTESADVLVESFRPGVLERLLRPPWPARLIVCRISGFGQSGPWRDRAGHDIGYLALSGVLARNKGVPAVQLADLFGGAQQAVIAVLAALVERGRTGQGRVIDVALTEGVTGLLLPALGEPHDAPNVL